MTRHPRCFTLIAFVDCVAVMLLGFGLMLQDGLVANMAGLVLVFGVQAFSMWYFLIAPARRVRMRLTVQDEADLLRQTGATEWTWDETTPSPRWTRIVDFSDLGVEAIVALPDNAYSLHRSYQLYLGGHIAYGELRINIANGEWEIIRSDECAVSANGHAPDADGEG